MKIAVLAAVAAMLAPIAQAQGCGSLNKIIAAAPGGFDDVIGAEIDDDYFNASVWLDASASGCWVDQTIVPVYLCGWNFGAQADAETVFAAADSAARTCLAGWRATDVSGKTTSDGDRMLKGVVFTDASSESVKTVVRIYTSSLMADRHHLAFEVERAEE